MNIIDTLAKWDAAKKGSAVPGLVQPLLSTRFNISPISGITDTSHADVATLTPQQHVEEIAILAARKSAGLPPEARPVENHTYWYVHRYAEALKEVEADGVTPDEWLAHAKALSNKYALDLVPSQAVSFTNASNFLSHPLPRLNGGPITAMVWVRREWTNLSYGNLMHLGVSGSSDTPVYAQIYTDPPFTFTLDNSESHGNQGGTPVTPAVGEWVHITQTFKEMIPGADYHHNLYAWDSVTAKIVQILNKNTANPLNPNVDRIWIGDKEAGTYPCLASFACLRVFAAALTPEQIAVERLSPVAVHRSVILDKRLNGVGDLEGFTVSGIGIISSSGPNLDEESAASAADPAPGVFARTWNYIRSFFV